MKNKSIMKKMMSCGLMILMIFSVVVMYPNVTKAESSHNPVVMVHGLTGSSSNFIFIESYLKSNGWSDDELYAVDLPIKTLNAINNSTNARALSNFIDDVLRKTGATEVDIVAHSMGGSNSLYYIQNLDGASKVDKVVTLGGANRLAVNRAPEGVSVTSIYSTTDLIVNNYLSILDGADNVRITGVGHISLLNSSKVKPLIVEALNK